MPISQTAHVMLNEPSGEIDVPGWLFGLSDADYQACACPGPTKPLASSWTSRDAAWSVSNRSAAT